MIWQHHALIALIATGGCLTIAAIGQPPPDYHARNDYRNRRSKQVKTTIITERRGDMNTAGKVVIGIAAAILVVGIIVGGYLGGWWLNKDINNRNAHIRRTTFEQQTTYRDEMIRKIADVRAIDAQDQTPEVQAQRKAIVAIVCRDNTHIQGQLDSSTARFVQEEC